MFFDEEKYYLKIIKSAIVIFFSLCNGIFLCVPFVPQRDALTYGVGIVVRAIHVATGNFSDKRSRLLHVSTVQ